MARIDIVGFDLTQSGTGLFTALHSWLRLASPVEDRPREGYLLDFKKEWGDSAVKTIAAFANTFGGLLVLGVTEDAGHPGILTGIAGPGELKTRIANAVATSLYPCPRFEIGECSLPASPDLRLAVVRVEESQEICLVTKKGLGSNPIFIRREDMSDPANAADVQALLSRKTQIKSGRTHPRGLSSDVKLRFRLHRLTNGANVAQPYLQILLEPTTNVPLRLDVQTEKVFSGSVERAFRLYRHRDAKVSVERDRDCFELHWVRTDTADELRWHLSREGDVAFVTSLCESTAERQSWSVVDVLLHCANQIAATRQFWARHQYFGPARLSLLLYPAKAHLQNVGGYSPRFYDAFRLLDLRLSPDLLVETDTPRDLAAAYLDVSFGELTDGLPETLTEAMNQLLRALGHGVRFEGLLETVRAWAIDLSAEHEPPL